MQKVILPFVAGFLAALFFRESTIALFHAAGVIDPAGYSTDPFLPLGIPEFIVNALWSAFFGILMAWLLRRIWPSGTMLPRLALGFASNAMWGWGALVFMRAFMASSDAD